MENDHHPNDDFTSNPTPEDSEFASWVLRSETLGAVVSYQRLI
jgi:hypothetical protein